MKQDTFSIILYRYSAPHLIEKTKDQTDTKPRRRNLKRATEFLEDRFGELGTPLGALLGAGRGRRTVVSDVVWDSLEARVGWALVRKGELETLIRASLGAAFELM